MADLATNPTQSSFDHHHAPDNDLINKCVHCGFCLQTCPTYALWHEEMDSPRGRIYLMKLASEGKVELNDKFVKHMDQCLGCMACMTACPSAVPYDKLIEATRAQIERNYPRRSSDKIFRKLVFSIFPEPARLRLLAVPLWLYQRSGLRKLVHASGLMKLFPRSIRSMEALLPAVTLSSSLPERIPAVGQQRRRVGMMTGCVQRVFLDRVNAATARVLAAEGCEVVIPEAQGCCGALMVHAGEEREALDHARRFIDVFERAEVDTIVINAAGCGSNVKEYGYLLRDDPEYAERAKRFAAKCKDVSEILAELKPQAVRHPLKLKVAYHDSCHLQHAQGIRSQPRALLSAIPELQLLEIAEAPICCGSAGIYNLVQPATAQELGDRKASNAAATGADFVATGNPGCLLQIRAGLERAGKPIPVLHTVELLDASIQGRLPESHV